ncbi:PfkB family carbohydrate kinase [Pseudodesulfovibrio sp.]|nr:PfkB family carbohydrate kinase [Pseudodesulfovibrio sp.]
MTGSKKILPIEDLAKILEKRGNKKVVLCHGVFDLLHIGHIRYFEQAKQAGDILVVTLTPDTFVDKGPQRPAFNEDLRAEGLASLQVVDYVAVNEWKTAEATIRTLRPDFYAKGAEFKDGEDNRVGKIGPEMVVVEEIGAKMLFTEDIVFSSSNLINRFLSGMSHEQQEYMHLFRSRHTFQDIETVLDDMSNLKVLVIGDAIMDEYNYGEAMGKSSKEPVLALKFESTDMFAGGVIAVANHVAGFAGKVDLACVLGEHDSHEEIIRKTLAESVTPRFFYQKDAPTIVKRRFIDTPSLNKLLEIYVMDDTGLDPQSDELFRQSIEESLAEYDLVIMADYGHGAISQAMADMLSEHAPYLAVNTQANAGNRGFHTISRYNTADFISLASHEFQLEFRGSRRQFRRDMDTLGSKLKSEIIVVTGGQTGCTVWDKHGEFARVPAFSTKAVDRVGAGDAFLSVAALAAKLDVDREMLGFLGNIAGALAVRVVGNEKSIGKERVEKFATALMK